MEETTSKYKKIFVNDISDRGLLSVILKRKLKVNNKWKFTTRTKIKMNKVHKYFYSQK
jgi:hypothetical protein